ncbi:glucosidase II [Savitreella phatthalungensis]
MVKKEDFKRCEQSSFCRRNHAIAKYAEEQGSKWTSPYVIPPDTIKLVDGILTADVIKTVDAAKQETRKFPMTLKFLENGVVRVTIDEQSRINGEIALPEGKDGKVNKQRYNKVEDYTIVGGLTPDTSVSKATKTKDTTSIAFGPEMKWQVVVNHSPVKIEFLRDGHSEVVLNDRGLINLEHWRAKPEDSGNGDEAAAYPPGYEKDGMWEETFNGKTDSKPRGPESIALDITFVGYTDVYGIPEHTGPLSLRETKGSGEGKFDQPYRLWNADVFQYEYDSPMALYGAVPFMQAHKKGSDVGVFWMNAAETWIDIEKTGSVAKNPLSFSTKAESTQTHWISESGLVDVFVFLGPDSRSLYKQYGGLIGHTRLPPLFSIAHHQCRWNYESETDVLDVTANFDKYHIPYDVIWLDIEYTDKKKYFTWDKNFFPNPDRMMSRLEETKRKLVAIIDPHVKKEDGFSLYKEAIAGDHCIKNADGGVYEGQCWPGLSIWPDFSRQSTRDWWAAKYDHKNFEGSLANLHVWNDMNEPAIFDGPDVSMHRDALHADGWEHRDMHNMYGSMMVSSSYEGLKARDPKEPKRPFILSRSWWAGTHRSAAIWTGDNMGTWEHMASAGPTLMNNGLAGMTFSGADVGGFFDDPPSDMLTRWYQAGAFYPFFRAHAHIDTKRREPWLIGEPYTSMIRDAIVLRYSLLTTWYTAFYTASKTGLPVLRPHFIQFPDDTDGFKEDRQYFIGDSGLLHHPVTSKDAESIELYLADDQPHYTYLDYDELRGKGSHTVKTELSHNPVFIHGGHIFTRRDRQRRSAELMRRDPVTLVVALDNAQFAQGELYMDDGETFRNEAGEYLHRRFTFTSGKLLSKDLHIGDSSQAAAKRKYADDVDSVFVEKVVLVGLKRTQATDVTVEQAGKHWQADLEHVRDLPLGRAVYHVRLPKVRVSGDWSIQVA